MDDEMRREHCRIFLEKGLERKNPRAREFAAYGQASLDMAQGIFELLHQCEAHLFACAIPRGVRPPTGFQYNEYLRKDHVFLFERYFYFLEEKQDDGLIVMDESEREQDKRFVRRLQRYFSRTSSGRYRASSIIPVPFFVGSDMAEAIQAADVCIYAINWGFRLPSRGMDADARSEIADNFGPWLARLQYRGQGRKDGEAFDTYGIVHVPDPFTAREQARVPQK